MEVGLHIISRRPRTSPPTASRRSSPRWRQECDHRRRDADLDVPSARSSSRPSTIPAEVFGSLAVIVLEPAYDEFVTGC